jgi:hypothetical protein
MRRLLSIRKENKAILAPTLSADGPFASRPVCLQNMPRVVLLLVVLVPFVLSLVLPTDVTLAKWNDFKLKYNKVYKTPEEESARFSIFQVNEFVAKPCDRSQ